MEHLKEQTQIQTTPGIKERGATMVEYALIVALMSLGSMASIGFMRDAVFDKFEESGRILGSGGGGVNEF
jgi:Flp pilus assembly pilin Flp